MRARHLKIALALALSACTRASPTAPPAPVLPTIASPDQISASPFPATRTPPPPADCPETDPSLQADFQRLVDQYGLEPEDELVLDFLNAGGRPEAALDALRSLDWPGGQIQSEIADVTGDGVPEMLLGLDDLYFLSCESGEFNTVDVVSHENGPVRVEAIQDMNLDGFPEIVTAIPVVGEDLVKVFSWDGAGFRNLVYDEQTGWDSAQAKEGLRVRDVNGDGTLELLVDNTPPGPREANFDAACWVPAHVTTDTFAWDGEQFTFSGQDFAPPAYRFEAARDGDALALQGRYEEARGRYLQVINDESLDGWSDDMRDYLLETEFGLDTYGFPITSPPEPLPEERVNLSAYATYRLMVLGVLNGDLEGAKDQFQSLQRRADDDTAWHLFSGLANEFWLEYQASHDMGTACSRAAAFVDSSPVYLEEVFWAVDQGTCDVSHVARDICPFE